jgi:EAL domain-containing protein (putative c-di-GMP-specific phosphodiesterase class I)
MSEDQTETALLEGLKAAIAAERIVPWFQPVMDNAGVDMLSAEALPRWEDPVRGVIPAGVFISTAIRHGLLADISRVLLGRSCANYADWRARGIAPPAVSVNFTGEELRSGVSVDQIRWAVEAHGMAPSQLAIEVPESVLYEEGWERNLSAIRELRALGVPFWLDDFGSDAGDPANLSKVDFALTKVDRKIVGALDEDPAMVGRLRTLVSEAKSHGMAIIAKGVETRPQIDILMGLGCDGQQGFAIARPMAEDAFAEWLDLNSWPGAATA